MTKPISKSEASNLQEMIQCSYCKKWQEVCVNVPFTCSCGNVIRVIRDEN